MHACGGLYDMPMGAALKGWSRERGWYPNAHAPVSGRPRFSLQWVGVLALYGIGFVALRSWSAQWATFNLFSLWFPAAGLRFAFLWFVGPRVTIWAACAEALASLGFGTVDLGPQPLLGIVRTVSPCLIYGLVIHLLGHGRTTPATSDINPLSFSAAAVISPILAGLGALATAFPELDATSHSDLRTVFDSMLVFALGDLLGILLIAPPLLALSTWRWRSPPLRMSGSVQSAHWIESVVVLASAWGLVWLLFELGYGVLLAPVLLATLWAGLRSGRVAAWIALAVSALIILPVSDTSFNELERIHAHMLLACIAAGGYLVGSYAESQERSAREIRRRDRLLFQAERLKTLRAMSLGVIHEISQPLSTIALEASSLTKVTATASPDYKAVHEMAERIGRKTNDLSELVRRFRRFGEGGPEERSLVGAKAILSDIIDLIRPEAEQAGVRLHVSPAPDVLVEVSDVEIRQALLNLARNALAASPQPGGSLWLSCRADDSSLSFTIENIRTGEPRPAGMRIGLLIAEAIAKVHGGNLHFDSPRPGRVRCNFVIPIAKSPDKQ